VPTTAIIRSAVNLERYDEQLEQLGFHVAVKGIWTLVGASTAEYGWKLHLSSVGWMASALLRAIAPILHAAKSPFKAARDSQILGMLNEGTLGATQVGKFVTVYPPSDEVCRRLAEELATVTNRFAGPRVVTDLFLGGVVYARFGPHSPRMKRDRLGLFQPANQPEGAGYMIPFIPPPGISNPFAGMAQQSNLATAGPQLIGPGYLISRIIQVHVKGSVFEAIDLRGQDTVTRVILKEGRPYVMSDKHGRDVRDRLRNEAAVHAALAGNSPVLAASPLFEHGGNLYLPLEYLEGRDFGERPAVPYAALTASEQKRLLQDLADTATAVAIFHREGYVHRDLSMRNIRLTSDNRVVLVDLEMAYRVGSGTVPFSQGTVGFISPQQLAADEPTLADDVYSLGAVIVCAITGFDPQRVLQGSAADYCSKIRMLSGAPDWLSRLASDCLTDEPADRPTIETIQSRLSDATAMDDSVDSLAGGQDLPAVIRAGLQWLLKGAPREDDVWLSPDLASTDHGSLRLVQAYRIYRSTNRGVSGVLYTLAKLHRYGFILEETTCQASAVVDWLLDHRFTQDDQMVGLHFGEAGVAVAIAEAVASRLIEPGPWLDSYMREALAGPIDWPDLTHGAAGQCFAAFLCADLLTKPELAKLADPCAMYLVNTQRDDGSWRLPTGVKGMEGATYSGFAHGVAGIVASLAYHARRTRDPASNAAALRGGEWLLAEAKAGRAAASLRWTLHTATDEAWSWWCHGGPGISLGLLGLFELTNDGTWSAAVRACLRAHPVHVRHSNLSQCHGLSGLGDILLEAHRVLGETEWLDRAKAIGVALVGLAARSADGTSWLVENPYRPTPDLMIGTAGVLHFLARLTVLDSTFGPPLLPAGKTS
jgi:serine/threonine protein kinase